ncbi:MAG TPA: prenyltransferase [Syntrophales bacterium]|nr:prenyltransferase [Syntrophales bacterium]
MPELMNKEIDMTEKLKKYFIAARPWSFTMSLISVSVGTLLAAAEGPVSWFWFAMVALGIVFFHASANLLNDYFDTRYGVDQQDSPTAKYRPQPILSGMLTPRETLAEAVILLIAAAAIGFAAAALRSPHVLWIGIIGLLTTVFYTAGPVKFKYRALGELAVFLMWGPLMIEGAYAVQHNAISMKAFYISVPFGVLVALVLFANNMRDIAYDSRHNVKTVSIMLGTEKSFILFAGLIVLAYAYVLVMIATGMMSPWGLLIFISLPKAVSLLKSFKARVPDGADALTAQFDTVFGILLMLAIFLGS